MYCDIHKHRLPADELAVMQSCIDRAVGLCKGHRLNSSATDSDTNCTMDKESMSKDIGIMDKEPPLKKARYSHPKGLDGCEIKSSPVVGSSGAYVKPDVSMENVADAEMFTGKSNDILTCEEQDLKSELSENSELPLVPKDISLSNPEQCNHLEFNSKSITMQIRHVHASDSSILDASTRRTEDDEVPDDDDQDDDEASDASKLVLSVIKTKVDIQTMKMCLQHTAESSYRPSTLVNTVASSIAGASSSGSTPASPRSLRGPQHASLATAASSSRHQGPVDDAEFNLAELATVDHNAENFCHCNDSSCLVCCRNAENANPAARSTARLSHWQDQHTAKAIVDNAINRTIEEMVIAPDQAVPAEACVYEADRIQCHGLVTTAQQSVHHLQQRLQPMINQLTQASDLVFARNIEQSRDELVAGRGSMPSSPGVDTV